MRRMGLSSRYFRLCKLVVGLMAGPLFLGSLTLWARPPQKTNNKPAASPILYVGLFNGQKVNIYPGATDQTPTSLYDGLANITGDLAIDQDQRVYAGSGSIVVFPKGGLVPSRRYMFPDQRQPSVAEGIAVGSDGKFYAALYGDGTVVVYDKGSSRQASLTIPVPANNTAYAVAVDKQNNVYVEYGPAAPFGSGGFIEKCAPGSTQCTD